MKSLPVIIAILLLMAYGANADVREITFENKGTDTVDDLHVTFESNGVEWDRNESHTFDNTRHTSPSPDYNFWGTSIPPGGSATMTFTRNGSIKVKEWWWTKGGNNEKDGKQVGDKKKDNGGSILAFSGGPATGNGLIRVSLGNDVMMFNSIPGMPPQQTMQTFATMMMQHYNGGGNIRTYGVFISPTSAMMMGNTLGDPLQNLQIEILSMDLSQPATLITNNPFTLRMTSLIEGRYDQGSLQQEGDYFDLYLRSNVPPFNVIHQSRCFTNQAGNSDALVYNVPNFQPFFIQIKHRNSIETWSAAGNIMFVNGQCYYDFSNSQFSAFGGNQIQEGSRYCLYSGDVNQDGTVDGTDIGMIDNDAYNFATGYLVTDLTGDETSDASDIATADNNAINFVSVIRP